MILGKVLVVLPKEMRKKTDAKKSEPAKKPQAKSTKGK